MMSNKKSSPSVLRLIVCLVCIGAGLFSLIRAYQHFRLDRQMKDLCTATVTATVTNCRRQVDSNGAEEYAPVYTYTVNGRAYTGKSQNFSPSKPNLGRQENIQYNPDDPEMFYDAHHRDKMVGCLLFAGVSLFVGLTGLLGKSRRQDLCAASAGERG